MPFPRHPVGFSPETLRLLDVAMTRLWLEQVAIGASLSLAEPSLREELHNQVVRIRELGRSRPSRTRPAQERDMAVRKFKLGEKVIYHAPRQAIGPSLYTVVKLLPLEGIEFTYRVKSPENVERAARESELTSLRGDTP
jgi:hypothetical protein